MIDTVTFVVANPAGFTHRTAYVPLSSRVGTPEMHAVFSSRTRPSGSSLASSYFGQLSRPSHATGTPPTVGSGMLAGHVKRLPTSHSSLMVLVGVSRGRLTGRNGGRVHPCDSASAKSSVENAMFGSPTS